MNHLFILLLAGLLTSSLSAQQPIEFDTGRPRAPINGVPVLGSGLALSKGYLRGVPVGELSGWTMTLWFQPNSEKKGELFGIVSNAKKNASVSLSYQSGTLTLTGPGRPGRNSKPLQLIARGIAPEKWHQVAITYSHLSGPALYLNGKLAAQGQKGSLGYSTRFDNYHFGAAVLGKRKIGAHFDGLIDDFALHSRPFSPEEITNTFQGPPISDALVAFNDFENINHRDYAVFTPSDRDSAYLTEGQKLYELNCTACHSKDGLTPPPNPLARSFTQHKMENGGDPLSMFNTLTYGFRNMMPATQLTPLQRYQVIHYLREVMVKEHAPKLYVKVEENYADTMPRSPESSNEEVLRVEALAKTGYLRDYGKALITPVVGGETQKNRSLNALVIDLGDQTTIGYDLGTMRSIGAWTGGFLDFSNTLHHMLRAPGLPTMNFAPIPASESWRWAIDGKAENPLPKITTATVLPEKQLRYHGHYPFGDEIVISYSVQGRAVLESPLAKKNSGETVIHHRLSIEPSDTALELVVLAIEGAQPTIEGPHARIGNHQVWLQGKANGLDWRTSSTGEIVLKIPASKTPLNVNIALASTSSPLSPSIQITDLSERTKGGPRRWSTTHTMKGKLATSTFQGYAMDSLPVPLKNAYNSWMRTSSLAFFPDGRLAVGTLSGDVWIVSGINDNLKEVTWQRFAAGLYEPLGMKVVDGVICLGTRGRIVKLHDTNKDGEADFHEAFYNENEPASGWHAYNFDLEVDHEGAFYYARVGGFSDWSIPGGIIKVSPDGKSSEVVGVGLRVPNGIGRLPDGRITFSDNQGNYVPASKISITRPGVFHGAGSWEKRKGNYDPESIVQPVIYMPQELDSSSGAQLWVPQDERFGPLGGQYFHTSYGKASTMILMLDELGETTQGAMFSLPLKMESGTMRVAKNDIDGQLYYSGLTGWQAGATREGSIQRLRFTGEKGLYLKQAKARAGRLELVFDQAIDEGSIDLNSWAATAWNYRWSEKYGSPHLKVTEPDVEGTDTWKIKNIKVTDNGKRLIIEIPNLQPCHTLKLDFKVSAKDSSQLSGPAYFTIHQLPD